MCLSKLFFLSLIKAILFLVLDAFSSMHISSFHTICFYVLCTLLFCLCVFILLLLFIFYFPHYSSLFLIIIHMIIFLSLFLVFFFIYLFVYFAFAFAALRLIDLFVFCPREQNPDLITWDALTIHASFFFRWSNDFHVLFKLFKFICTCLIFVYNDIFPWFSVDISKCWSRKRICLFSNKWWCIFQPSYSTGMLCHILSYHILAYVFFRFFNAE